VARDGTRLNDRRPRLTGSLFALCGALAGGLAVLAGAFGAHALRQRLEPGALAVFETAARYQFYHALALLAAAWLLDRTGQPAARLAAWLFIAGIAVFSGSLYVLALSGLHWLGAITPLGGVAFIAGWLSLALAAWRG